MTTEPKVRLEGVTKIFGDQPESALPLVDEGLSKTEIQARTGQVVAVSNVSLSVEQGQTFIVMGLSGSGKSTLVRCVNQLISPTHGRVYLDEQDLTRAMPDELREIRLTRLTMMFQQFGLFPHKTVLDNVAFGLKMRGAAAPERRNKAMEVLEMVGLTEWAAYKPDALSGGMQQRVGLARALATDADVLLMDEPFSALDPLIRRDMQDQFLNLEHEMRKTILFITHDLHEALKMGDMLAIMKDGQIDQIGDPEQIISNPATEYVSRFTEDVDRSRVFTVGSIMKPTEALKRSKDGVESAVSRMEALERRALFVVDDAGKPVGLVSYEDALRASSNGDLSVNQVTKTAFPQALPDTPLADVYDFLTRDSALAVVGEDNKLQGVVSQTDVFEALAAPPAATDESESH